VLNRSGGVNKTTILFISIVIGSLGVGSDEISMVKSTFAAMVTPAGTTNPILVLTVDAVNGLVTEPTLICPSKGKSLKLLKPSGKIINK
jgi:hypothetical protein